jgi:hypothetical protein
MRWTWFREWPRTRSWAWDGVHLEAQNKDKVMGMGRGTCRSPRHLSCLLSRTYRTGCNGRDDCCGPRSNAVDWATQVSQIKQGVLAGRLAEQARSLCQKHWLSKQGVLAGRLAKQARSLGQKHWLSKQGVLARSIG